MKKSFITPDVAELIGAYLEGAKLSTSEMAIIEPFLQSEIFSEKSEEEAIMMQSITDFNDLLGENHFPFGTMAIDYIDGNSLNVEDMNANSAIGDVTPFPEVMSHDIIQHQSDTCAIKSQQIILHSFGMDIPEELLTIEATGKGYYIPGQGSSPDQIGMLLEDHGVGTHTKYHATVYDLAAELAQGHKVIVGVDADELWRPSYYNDLFGEQANHALIVTGIDTTNPNDIRVIITDPGTGDVARTYPMAQFLDAWHDSSCMMVATDMAPQVSYAGIIINPEMINFDYINGHIPYVGNIPYDIFTGNMLPRFDDYFNHQLGEIHSSLDYQHLFDHMDDAYGNFDNHFSDNDTDDALDVDGLDNLFSPLFF